MLKTILQDRHIFPMRRLPYGSPIWVWIKTLRLGSIAGAAGAQALPSRCRSGRRAGIALATLEEMGYTNATNVGGIGDARELED